MIYAKFYQTGTTGKLIGACGDRSVIILDGRRSLWVHEAIAAESCKARGYIAWQLFKGDRFELTRPLSNIEYI